MSFSSQSTSRDKRTKRALSSSDQDSDAHYKRIRKKSGDKGSESSMVKKSITGLKIKAKQGRSASKQSSEESEKTKLTVDNPTVSINSHSQIISAPKPVTFNLTRSTNIPQSVAQLVSDMSYEAQLADPVSSPILFKLQSVKYRGEICSFYNVGKCTRPTPHSKTYRNDCEKMYIHLCAYCNAKFNFAMAHTFEECPFEMLRNHVPKH